MYENISSNSDKESSYCKNFLKFFFILLIIGLVLSPIIACSVLIDRVYVPIKNENIWNEQACIVTDTTLVYFDPEYKILVDYCSNNRCKDDIIPYTGGYTLEEVTMLLNTTYLEGNSIIGHQNKNYLTISEDRMDNIRSRAQSNYDMCTGLMVGYIIILVIILCMSYNK